MKFIIQRIPYLLNKIHQSKFANIGLSIFLENLYAKFRKKDIKFLNDKKNKFIKAQSSIDKKYYPDKMRCFRLYRNGIAERGASLFLSYCLDQINFNKNDIVVDCGANSGDLFIELKKYIKSKNYIAIEPNPEDFRSLNINCKGARLINKALGKTNSTSKFFINTTLADSSIIEPIKYDKVIDIEVVRLDYLMDLLKINSIKLLKVEAEGYEPEILKGAKSIFENIEYIAIDGGFERGKKAEQTFTLSSNLLINNNFEMIDIGRKNLRALFKKKSN